MSTYAVIMAGGGGTRLWPLSRRKRPKQVLRVFGQQTMFQLAVRRLLPLIPPERIYVVALEEHAGELRAQAPELPEASFLMEPCPRGTASVIGLAAVALMARDPRAIMACLTADHYIVDVDRFRLVLKAAFRLAEDGDLVTLGIPPTYPATGFGYIQSGEDRGTFEGLRAFRVASFKEKPGLPEAERYLASATYYWNSGMFIWKASVILEEIQRLMPGLSSALETIRNALGKPDERQVLLSVWREIQKQTIDYGVMEKARNVSVIPAADLGWWDLGSWDRLFEVGRTDALGNLLLASDARLSDTRNTLVYQDPEIAERRLIAALGVDGLVIVDTGDVLLVCPRERTEDIRRLVEELERDGEEDLL